MHNDFSQIQLPVALFQIVINPTFSYAPNLSNWSSW